MVAEISENDLLGKAGTTSADVIEADQATSNPLHLLQQALAAMPAADAERVQAALNKLRNGSLEIMGTAEERLESAMRIAKHIIDEASGSGQ